MKTAIFVVLAFCLSINSFSTFAQKNYSPGYVVHIDGDTTRGLIKYFRWDKNPRFISFITKAGAEETEYRPEEIASFFVGGEHYESSTVDVDISPIKIGTMEEHSEPRFVKKTVFLQVLFRGAKTLLYLKDQDGKEHFYIDDHGHKPLVYKKFTRTVESAGILRKLVEENLEYKKTLFFYFDNCPSIQQHIENTRYETRALSKLFTAYSQCINNPVHYVNPRNIVEIETGLLLGAGTTKLAFRGERLPYYYLIDCDYNQSLTPTFGVFFDARLLRTRGLKITNDLFYTSFNADGKANVYNGDRVEASFTYSFLRMHTLLQMNLLPDGLLHLSAGGLSAAIIRNGHDINILRADGSTIKKDFASRKFEYGLVGGIGTDRNNLTIAIRYEVYSGISKYATVSAGGARFYVIGKYRLNRSR